MFNRRNFLAGLGALPIAGFMGFGRKEDAINGPPILNNWGYGESTQRYSLDINNSSPHVKFHKDIRCHYAGNIKITIFDKEKQLEYIWKSTYYEHNIDVASEFMKQNTSIVLKDISHFTNSDNDRWIWEYTNDQNIKSYLVFWLNNLTKLSQRKEYIAKLLKNA